MTAPARAATPPVRPVADGLLPRRRGTHGALQLGDRPPARRHVRAAHRGHRRSAQPSGVDRRHHRVVGVDRHLVRRPVVRGAVLPELLRERPPRSGDTALRVRIRLLLRPDAPKRSRSAPRPAASPATTATRVTVGSNRGPAACCDSACPTGRRSSATSCEVRSSSTTSTSRTSCCCAGTARRCSCSPMSSTTWRWGSPMSCAPRSISPTRRSSRCCGRRSDTSRRHGPMCRCWSTSSARSSRSDATRSPSSSTAPRATSPTRWSTT